MSTNIILREQNLQIFGPNCAAGGLVHIRNPLTLHHITPKCEGGPTILSNSSNVCNLEHSGIHALSQDIKRAKAIRDYLLDYRQHPDKVAALQFHEWLVAELDRMGMAVFSTRDRLLIYKRA